MMVPALVLLLVLVALGAALYRWRRRRRAAWPAAAGKYLRRLAIDWKLTPAPGRFERDAALRERLREFMRNRRRTGPAADGAIGEGWRR
jgi:hypothetical protein